MTDEEFLLYCETHCQSPRAAFVPAQIARLYRMAGHDCTAEIYESLPNAIMDGWKYRVLDLIKSIRERHV